MSGCVVKPSLVVTIESELCREPEARNDHFKIHTRIHTGDNLVGTKKQEMTADDKPTHLTCLITNYYYSAGSIVYISCATVLILCKRFEDAHEITHWRKVKQMQPV